MSYEVLYYPNFQPNLEWLKSMLLVSDTVERIVPYGVDLQDPVELRDLLTVLPDSLKAVPPENPDVQLEGRQLERLDKVFHWIANRLRNGAPAGEPTGKVDEAVRARVFLHQAKASHEVRQMLVAHGLLDPALLDMGAIFGAGDRLILPQLASTFLLSIVAERMSGRTGRDVVTDEILPATFLGIDAISSARPAEVGAAEGQVGQSFVRMFIPKALNRLPLDKYLKLREEFLDLRYAFRQLVRQAAAEYDLNRRPEAKEIEQRVREATLEYAGRYADFRTRDVARSLDSWGWFSAVNGVSLAKTALKPFSLPLGFLEVGLKIGEKLFSSAQTAGPHDATFKMLVRLDNKLMKAVPMNEWL
jgi:hypothetical protein